MTVNQVLTEMSSTEISEWMAFDMIDDDFIRKVEAENMTMQERDNQLKQLMRSF